MGILRRARPPHRVKVGRVAHVAAAERSADPCGTLQRSAAPPPRRGVLFHSDQGIEYAANSFKALLARHHLTQSMSRRAYCYDNAHVESFFGPLKAESDVTERRLQQSVSTLISHVDDYLRFYNGVGYTRRRGFNRRPHSGN